MNKLLRLLNGYEGLAPSKFLVKMNAVHQGISTATSFYPTPNPTMADFLAGIEEYQSTVNNAVSGDKNKIIARDNQKLVMVDMMHRLGYYVLFASGGDRTIASLSNFDFARDPSPQPEMGPPQDLQVTPGDQSGVVNVKVKTVRGAVAYTPQYTTDPELKEETWVTEMCSTTKCTISNLTPGTKYFFRVGAIGRKGQVKFSDVISKIVA